MPSVLESLIVELNGSTQLLRQELDRGTKDVSGFVQKSEGHLGRLDKRFANLGRGIRSALASFGVAFSIGGIALFAKSAIAAGDALGKAADTAGIAAERLQELRFAFGQLAGTTDKEVDESIRRFNRRLGLAIQGTGEAKATFRDLGVEFTHTSGADTRRWFSTR
jgi:hypothetical protein